MFSGYCERAVCEALGPTFVSSEILWFVSYVPFVVAFSGFAPFSLGSFEMSRTGPA